MAIGLGGSLLWPVQAFANAVIRFIHGVPGVGAASVSVDGRTLGIIGFAQSTRFADIRSGAFRWALARGGRTLARGTATVADGSYDIVILERGAQVTLGIYRDQPGRPGTSLVRVIHAAPELGSPELTIDGRPAVTRLGYTRASPYVPLGAGTHTLGAMRPGDRAPLVAGAMVHLASGRSYSAVVVGTRGQRVRVVEVTDSGAPLTRPAALPAAAPAGMMVVRRGDSLWSIARRLLGAGAGDEAVSRMVRAIWQLNRARIGTGDPNVIFPGTSLRLPSG